MGTHANQKRLLRHHPCCSRTVSGSVQGLGEIVQPVVHRVAADVRKRHNGLLFYCDCFASRSRTAVRSSSSIQAATDS